jgi:hypothetical protein
MTEKKLKLKNSRVEIPQKRSSNEKRDYENVESKNAADFIGGLAKLVFGLENDELSIVE